MATKRRQEQEQDGDDDTVEAVESKAGSFAKPVFIVAEGADGKPGYSVYKVDAAAVPSDAARRPRAVAHLPTGDMDGGQGMSFVTAHSKLGSWIVGVGGEQKTHCIIYDPVTSKIVEGPHMEGRKHKPVLISHGGKVYAISRRPRVVRGIDFEPWFEYLNFKKGGNPRCWIDLESPPCFPCYLDPLEFLNPPDVSVTSYAAVGSHILISLDQQESGTYGFHVADKEWDKVHDKNLPFVGQAVPLGGGRFAACPRSNNGVVASVFHMAIVDDSTTGSRLSVLEFPVASENTIPGHLFYPLGKGSFCSTRLSRSAPTRPRNRRLRFYSKMFQIDLTSYEIMEENSVKMKNIMEGSAVEDLDLPVAAVQVKEHKQTLRLRSQCCSMACPMPVVAVLSMDRENTELFEEKKIKTATRPETDIIFTGPTIIFNRI